MNRLLLKLLAWLFPPTPLESVTPLSFDELQAKYRTRDRWLNVVAGLSFVGLAVAFFFLLDVATTRFYRDYADAPFLLRPARFEFGVIAALLSLFSVGFWLVLAIRVWLGSDEFNVYMAYGSLKTSPGQPYSVPRVFTLFFIVVFLPSVAALVLYIDSYAVFRKDSMTYSPYWSLGQEITQDYANVDGIYEVKQHRWLGKERFQPYELIAFADGTRWESDHGKGGSLLEKLRSIAEYVSQQSGVPYQPVNFVEDVPEVER